MANAIEILINARNNATPAIDRATVSVASLTKGVLASVGAFAAVQLSMQAVSAAAVGIATTFANEVEQLDRLSAMTGLTNEQLQVFRRGLERAGLPAEQLNLALRFFQNQLASNRKELALYGITSDDTFGALRDLARAMQGAGNDAERVELAAKTLGMRNVELAQTVTAVATRYDSELKAALAGGAVMSDGMSESMRGLDDSLDNFMDTVRAFKLEVADMFGPMLKGAADLMNFINRFNRGTEWVGTQVGTAIGTGLRGMFGAAPFEARFLQSAHGDPFSTGASEPFDQAGWVKRYRDRMAAMPPSPGDILSGYSFGTEGPSLSQRSGSPARALADVVKVLQEAEPVANAYEQGLQRMNKMQQEVAEYALQAGANIQSSMTASIMSLVMGAQSIGQAFRQLIMDVFASIAEAIATYLAKQGAGWLLSGIGGLIGGPVGAAITGAGGAMRGNAMAGGNTFILQSIDSKTALDSLVSPTGSMRRANDRVYEVAMAGSL